MNTALATRNGNTAIEVPADFVPVAGLSELSPDDFSIGVLKLIQTKTQIDGEDAGDSSVGKWLRTDTGDVIENPDLVFIGIAKQRALFRSEFSGDKTPLCRSDNGLTPRSEYVGIALYVEAANKHRKAIVAAVVGDEGNFFIGSICANCPLSQWVEGNPPPCTLSDSWAAVTPECDPVLVRFGKSSAAVGKKLKTMARIYSKKMKPLHFVLGSHVAPSDISTYYVPDILPATTELSPELVEIAREFASVNLAARYDDLKDDEDQPAAPAKTHIVDLNPNMTNMPEEDEVYPF